MRRNRTLGTELPQCRPLAARAERQSHSYRINDRRLALKRKRIGAGEASETRFARSGSGTRSTQRDLREPVCATRSARPGLRDAIILQRIRREILPGRVHHHQNRILPITLPHSRAYESPDSPSGLLSFRLVAFGAQRAVCSTFIMSSLRPA